MEEESRDIQGQQYNVWLDIDTNTRKKYDNDVRMLTKYETIKFQLLLKNKGGTGRM